MERKTILLIIGAVVAIAIVVALVVWSRRREASKQGYAPPPPPAAAGGPPNAAPQGPVERPELVLFWSQGCGHCHKMMPEWQKLVAELKGRFQVVDIEASNPAVHQFGIRGFPTIRLYPRGLGVPGEAIEYSGPRTADALMEFITTGGGGGGGGGGHPSGPPPSGPPPGYGPDTPAYGMDAIAPPGRNPSGYATMG